MSRQQTRLEVRVVPTASHNQVVGLVQGAWRIRVAAPPVAGRANAELIAFLARVLGLPRRQVCLLRGHTSRSKTVSIAGLSPDAVAARLGEVARGSPPAALTSDD